MTTPADLFLAILALDAYNRGNGPGMNFVGNSADPGTQIGDATIETATSPGDQKSAARSNFDIAIERDEYIYFYRSYSVADVFGGL
jgi:hypothetical protein